MMIKQNWSFLSQNKTEIFDECWICHIFTQKITGHTESPLTDAYSIIINMIFFVQQFFFQGVQRKQICGRV